MSVITRNPNLNLFLSAVMAGLCIAIGCIANLKVGGIAGAVLFTFGLITVVHYKYALYTGTAGFIKSWYDFGKLFSIIFMGNILGCFFFAICLNVTDCLQELHESVIPIIQQRNSQSLWSALVRSILCGFLMTTAVKFARENRWLPLLFAVPLFILAGFYHSIADWFYLTMNQMENMDQAYHNWYMSIFGNFLGCNLYRITKND